MLSIRLRFSGLLSTILRRAVPAFAFLLSCVPALAAPHWTALGPFGGMRGRVFRSGDSGASWQDLSDGLQTSVVYELVIDPTNPRRIYAATSTGVWVLREED